MTIEIGPVLAEAVQFVAFILACGIAFSGALSSRGR